MIGFPIGLLYSNAGEWLIHKYILHGLGKNKQSFWSFHWHDHHNKARKNFMRDDHYHESLLTWGPHSKEVLSLIGTAALHAPLFPVAPFFTLAVWLSTANYYRVHRKSHLDPEWAKEHLPWHVDHHMGANQHSNWCVSFPLFDWIMKTRNKYVGTQKYYDDLAREEARARNAAAAAAPHAVPQAA